MVTLMLELCGKIIAIITFLRSVFQAIENWPSVFWHPKQKVVLSVYVDDFLMAGRQTSVSDMWIQIKSGLGMDPPGPLSLYLGAEYTMSNRKIDDISTIPNLMSENTTKNYRKFDNSELHDRKYHNNL